VYVFVSHRVCCRILDAYVCLMISGPLSCFSIRLCMFGYTPNIMNESHVYTCICTHVNVHTWIRSHNVPWSGDPSKRCEALTKPSRRLMADTLSAEADLLMD
jgi:hypothetical protein